MYKAAFRLTYVIIGYILLVKGTLIISSSSYGNNVEDFVLLKHLLLSEICAREICEKFVYKHSVTREYVKS